MRDNWSGYNPLFFSTKLCKTRNYILLNLLSERPAIDIRLRSLISFSRLTTNFMNHDFHDNIFQSQELIH